MITSNVVSPPLTQSACPTPVLTPPAVDTSHPIRDTFQWVKHNPNETMFRTFFGALGAVPGVGAGVNGMFGVALGMRDNAWPGYIAGLGGAAVNGAALVAFAAGQPVIGFACMAASAATAVYICSKR